MKSFIDYFRCPEEYAAFDAPAECVGAAGYFRFGSDAVCFGHTGANQPPRAFRAELHDVTADICIRDSVCTLPFNPSEVVDNLRFERYVNGEHKSVTTPGIRNTARKAYSYIRPMLPVPLRQQLQRLHVRGWEGIRFPSWPVDRTVDRIFARLLGLSLQTLGVPAIPFIWFWPEGFSSCAIMTHDVETESGRDFCSRVMAWDESRGIKSSFQLIPEERYEVSPTFLQTFRDRGFEVNVHDLNHDGNLFSDREEFLRRAGRINQYARQFGSVGFRSGVLYRNPEWCEALNFNYDMSFPNVGHLEAQRGGCCTVMPFFIGKILELPLTTTQDYALFHLLDDYSLDLWIRQIRTIMEGHGLVSCLAHPDYLAEKNAQRTYEGLLDHLAQLRAQSALWIALPRDVNRWWRERAAMSLVRHGDTWKIEGQGSERARIAWASLDGDRVRYSLEKGGASSVPGGIPVRPAALSEVDRGRQLRIVPAGAKLSSLPSSTSSDHIRPGYTQVESSLAAPVRFEHCALVKEQKTAICIVVENLPVPRDRRVWTEARTLRDAGYSVHVICPKGKGPLAAGSEVLDGIHIYRHRSREATTLAGYLLEYSWALAAELYLVLKVFAKVRFRVLHGCNPPDTIFLLGLILKPFGVRFIFDHHDLAPELFESKFGRRNRLLHAFTWIAEKCSFKVASVSIATNESFKDIAVKRGGKRPDQVFVVRNCPDLSTLKVGPVRPEIKAGKPLAVVYVGLMAEQDGLDLLIEAIEHIVKKEKREDTHFVLVGGGTMLPELQAMVVRKELARFVTFTGQVSHEEVIAHLSNADIGVAPDPKTPMNDNSTMIKLFEYMAFGLPIVLFDLKEGRRIAGPGALYASPNDPIDFAKQVNRLLDSSELRQELGKCGRKRIEDSLNWDAEKKSLLLAYNAALQTD